MRIVIDVKRDANANVVLNSLYKHTALQSSFNVNNICLVNGKPKQLNIVELIKYYVDHRHHVVVRRTQFELKQAEQRAHILEGLLIALDHIDEVINLIRSSKTVEIAKEGLIVQFKLSEEQAKAILAMRLQTLTGLEREKLEQEYNELIETIKRLKEILASESLRMQIIKDELISLKEKYGDERRTAIEYNADEFNPEDFYANDDVVITISHHGYIKRTLLSEYRVQNRGGVGSRASDIRDEDYIEHVYVAKMHNTLLLFTEKGRCYWLKVYEIPEGSKSSRGRAIQNILNIEQGDKIKAYVHVERLDDDEYIKNHYIVLCTRKGIIKKTTLEAYSRPRTSGIIAINIHEGDELIEAKLTNGNHHIIIANRGGRAVRFHESKVRPMGRNAAGVKGITLVDPVHGGAVGMICVEGESEDILVVSENGYGKRSKISEYPITNRGGKGVKTMNITEKTGKLFSIKGVVDTDHLMIITKNGIAIRLEVKELRVLGRSTQGVRLINLRDGDEIASITYIETNGEDEQPDENGKEIDINNLTNNENE